MPFNTGNERHVHNVPYISGSFVQFSYSPARKVSKTQMINTTFARIERPRASTWTDHVVPALNSHTTEDVSKNQDQARHKKSSVCWMGQFIAPLWELVNEMKQGKGKGKTQTVAQVNIIGLNDYSMWDV